MTMDSPPVLADLPLVAFPCPNFFGLFGKSQSTINLYFSDPIAHQTFASVPKGGNVGVIYNEVDSANMKRLSTEGFLARLVRTTGGNGATLMARVECMCDIEIIGPIQRDESGGMVGKVDREATMASYRRARGGHFWNRCCGKPKPSFSFLGDTDMRRDREQAAAAAAACSQAAPAATEPTVEHNEEALQYL